LLRDGHVDYAVRRAIEEGIDPVRAIQMATLNTAEHFEVARELGSIAPSRFADIIILDDLEKVSVNTVIADGKVVSRNGKLTANIPTPKFAEFVRNSVNLKHSPCVDDLAIKTKTSGRLTEVRAIGVTPTDILTRNLERYARTLTRMWQR
jgi:adenine deaminase